MRRFHFFTARNGEILIKDEFEGTIAKTMNEDHANTIVNALNSDKTLETL